MLKKGESVYLVKLKKYDLEDALFQISEGIITATNEVNSYLSIEDSLGEKYFLNSPKIDSHDLEFSSSQKVCIFSELTLAESFLERYWLKEKERFANSFKAIQSVMSDIESDKTILNLEAVQFFVKNAGDYYEQLMSRHSDSFSESQKPFLRCCIGFSPRGYSVWLGQVMLDLESEQGLMTKNYVENSDRLHSITFFEGGHLVSPLNEELPLNSDLECIFNKKTGRNFALDLIKFISIDGLTEESLIEEVSAFVKKNIHYINDMAAYVNGFKQVFENDFSTLYVDYQFEQ